MKAIDSKRRSPVRANARETVAVIFEATARILQTGGREALNTNRIAELAGVSIGSLYAYFPNKEAILLAMARQELDAIRDRVAAALLSEAGGVAHDPVRRAVRALLTGYGTRSKARRILMEALFSAGGSAEMARPTHEIADLILAHGARLLPQGAAMPTPIAMFVLTRAVDGVIRAATYEEAAFISSAEFEDELVRLVKGYLTAGPA